jgi:hypothetical protein
MIYACLQSQLFFKSYLRFFVCSGSFECSQLGSVGASSAQLAALMNAFQDIALHVQLCGF